MTEPVAAAAPAPVERPGSIEPAPPAGFDAFLERASAAAGAAYSLTLGEFVTFTDGSVPDGAAPIGHVLASTGIGSPARSPGGDWTGVLPAGAAQWIPAIEAAAERYGLDPRLLAAVTWVESDFHPDAVSHAGAVGLTQLMPGTAELLGVDPTDPLQNLDGGARFLDFVIDRFGRIDLGLAAYNAGPARVAEGDIPPETYSYVERVLGLVHRMGGSL